MTPRTHAWADRFPKLVESPAESILESLRSFVPDAGPAQTDAWRSSVEVLKDQGAIVLRELPPAHDHAAVLEYLLPWEGGRRPDVLVLQNGRVVVLEFKEHGAVRRADLDQVAAYARDLASYHSACHELTVTPVLVLCGAGARSREIEGVRVVPAGDLAALLVELGRESSGPAIDLVTFLDGEYVPLPTLVAAARLLFENQPLPFIRRANSAGVGDAAVEVLKVAREASEAGGRRLVLLTGVPGAGKTLVGLQVTHSAALESGYRFEKRRRRGAPSTFLSGNGPLVQVLQNALQSTAFVQDMHRYIREYGLERLELVPPEHLIVFDEAQRAWDARKLEDFYSKKLGGTREGLCRSEPELLVGIAERIPDWSTVLALVGTGQEIHVGEEGGCSSGSRRSRAPAIPRDGRSWGLRSCRRASGPPGCTTASPPSST